MSRRSRRSHLPLTTKAQPTARSTQPGTSECHRHSTRFSARERSGKDRLQNAIVVSKNRHTEWEESTEALTLRIVRRQRVVHDVRLAAIQRADETGMAGAVNALVRVLVEDTSVAMFAPALRLPGVGAREFQQAETVEGRVDAGGGVDDEGLVGVRVRELRGAFVGGKVGESARWDLFPGFGGDGEKAALEEGGDRGGRAGDVSYAEVGGPAVLWWETRLVSTAECGRGKVGE